MNEVKTTGAESAFSFGSIFLNIVQPVVGLTLFIVGMMVFRKRSKEDEEQGNL